MSKQDFQEYWYKQWWGILLIICLFPIFVPYFVWTKTSWHWRVKFGITLMCVMFALYVLSDHSKDEKKGEVRLKQYEAKPSEKTDQSASQKEKNNKQVTTKENKWVRACGHIYQGVKIYYGTAENNFYVGQVLGGNDHYVNSYTGETFKGLKLLMKSGKPEWKDRHALCLDERWIIKSDDPFLNNSAWTEYQF